MSVFRYYSDEDPVFPNDVKLHWLRDCDVLARGIVYYLQRSDLAIKVGCSINYHSRRRDLVRVHGPLHFVAWESGYRDLETLRHWQFARQRLDPVAEWFHPEGELLDHVCYLRALL